MNEKKTFPDIQNSLLLALLEPHYWPMLECSSMPQSFCKPWKKVESIWFVLQRQNLRNLPKLEIVMNEMRKNQKFHFDLQIHPTLLNSTCLHCQMTGFIPIRVQNFQNVE